MRGSFRGTVEPLDTLGLIKCVLIREVSSFQGANNTWSSILIREVSLTPFTDHKKQLKEAESMY